MKRVLLFFIFLDICGISVFSQFVTLEERQFKDTNGVALYPLVCNYMIDMPYEDTIDYNFLITPNHSYGKFIIDDFLTLDSATIRIHNDFNEIKNMGFNAIRLMSMLTKDNDTIESIYSYTGGFFRWDCKFRSEWDTLKVEHQYLFPRPYNTCGILATLLHQYRQIIRIAAKAGLYVILVPAGGDDLFKNSTEASDYADLLMEFCDTLKNETNLLAYDLVNEPEFATWSHTKGEICDWTSELYDAVHSVDPNHLITIGGSVANLSAVFEWDPSVMKIDFWSPHTYISYNSRLPVSLNTGLESVTNAIIWVQNNCPIPWIIGETGFVAEDVYDLSVVWGTENEQSIYASKTLDTVRNAGGSGYSWWMFQHVGWHGTLDPPPHNDKPNHQFGTDDYYRDVTGYYQDNFGLLGVGNPNYCSPTTYECDYSDLEKPVVEVFQNYLNPDPPDPGPPPVPNNYGLTGNNPNHPNKITGRIVDQNNVPIKDAVIKGWNFVKSLSFDKPETPEIDDFEYKDLWNSQYTFSDENGYFTIIPYDYISGIEHYLPINGLEYFENLIISCVGGEKFVIGKEEPNNPAIRFYETYDLSEINGLTIVIFRNSYGFEYDKVVSNKTIDINSAPVIFSAWNKLTVNDVTILGNGAQGGIADFTARTEVQVNKEFDAQRGSEVHIFNSEVFRNCDSVSSFKKGVYKGIPSNNQLDGSEEREIELSFFKERKGLSVYPNPTSGPLTVEIQNAASPDNYLVISDMYGKKIMQFTCEKTSQFDLTGFPCGIYIINGYSEVEQFGSCKIILY